MPILYSLLVSTLKNSESGKNQGPQKTRSLGMLTVLGDRSLDTHFLFDYYFIFYYWYSCGVGSGGACHGVHMRSENNSDLYTGSRDATQVARLASLSASISLAILAGHIQLQYTINNNIRPEEMAQWSRTLAVLARFPAPMSGGLQQNSPHLKLQLYGIRWLPQVYIHTHLRRNLFKTNNIA